MPSPRRIRSALRPSTVVGSLTTTFGAIFASSRPCWTMPSVSVATTSRLTGPSTIRQISSTRSRNGRFSLATSEGLVVAPSRRPIAVASLSSFTLRGVEEDLHGRSPSVLIGPTAGPRSVSVVVCWPRARRPPPARDAPASPARTALNTVGSPSTRPKTLTGLAGRHSSPRLAGVGPKKMQNARPGGQYPRSPTLDHGLGVVLRRATRGSGSRSRRPRSGRPPRSGARPRSPAPSASRRASPAPTTAPATIRSAIATGPVYRPAALAATAGPARAVSRPAAARPRAARIGNARRLTPMDRPLPWRQRRATATHVPEETPCRSIS